jgi:DNA mismatch endonuclease (patch repair protein)
MRSSGNRTTELQLRLLLRRHRISGWRQGSRLPGKPDFIFPCSKVAVFVDGDFWHGHPRRCNMPARNRGYWEAVIQKNRRRDERVNRILKNLGWNVLRIWEGNLRKDEMAAIGKLQVLL